MIDFILFIAYSIFTLILIYLVIKLKIQNKKIIQLLFQSELDKSLINREFEKLLMENSNRELLESDGFIKFISDSRDWAFEYIEEVQKALVEFDNEVKPILEYHAKYGNVLGETIHTTKLDKISLAYDKLKPILPENNETPNN